MLKQVGIGLISGVVATAVMDRSQHMLFPAVGGWIGSITHHEDMNPREETRSPHEASGETPERAPERMADWLARKLDVTISRSRARTLGKRIRWTYGVQLGIPYALMPISSGPRTGLLFGAALWLAADEVLFWALGFAGPPTSYPVTTHLKTLAAHLLYGAALGSAVLGLETALEQRRSRS